MTSAAWGKVRAALKVKVEAQIKRHLAMDPNTDPKRMVELQIRLEKENLQRKLKRIEDGEIEDPDGTEELILRSIINVVLPEVARQLMQQF